MKIYTKRGDMGLSSTISQKNIEKKSDVFHLLGTLDELNAHLGLCIHELNEKFNSVLMRQTERDLIQIQTFLFTFGTMVAKEVYNTDKLQENTALLEVAIDHMDEILPPLRHFILPGGQSVSCQLHIARAVCRRLERYLYLDISYMYINRLSDYLFTCARYTNYQLGLSETTV